MKLRFSLMAAVLVLFVGIIPSERFHLYSRFIYFDKVMHLLGGFVIAWLFWNLFYSDLKKLSLPGFCFFLISAAVTVGVFWEFLEYLSGLYLGQAHTPGLALFYRYFHGGDLKDTLGDLLADSIGGILFVLTALGIRRTTSS